MRDSIRFSRAVVGGIIAAVAIWVTSPVAHAESEGPVVPVEIRVPDGNKVFLVGHAVGVQIYSCNATSSGFAWVFVAPRADLFSDKGKLVTTHFAGPTWQAVDGSRVVGQRVNGVTVDASAIPWLLLSAASTTPGPGGDRMTNTTFIQRTATTGGLAPAATECNAGTVGTTAEVPYTADYYFWKSKGH